MRKLVNGLFSSVPDAELVTMIHALDIPEADLETDEPPVDHLE